MPLPLICFGGAALLLALFLVTRRRDPSFEAAVREAERQHAVQEEVKSRQERQHFLAMLFAISGAAIVAWFYLGCPTSWGDAVLAIKQLISSSKH